RLRQVGKPLALLELERPCVLRRLDQDDRLGSLPHRPFDLDVAGVADERDLQAAGGVATRFGVHLGDERADRVDDLEPSVRALLVDLRRDPVRGEDDERAFRHVLLGVDEHGAPGLEVAHDMDVVDDLVPDVDRCAVLLEQLLDDVDRADDARAEAAGSRDEDSLAHASSLAARAKAAVALRASKAVPIDRTGWVSYARPTTLQSVPPS